MADERTRLETGRLELLVTIVGRSKADSMLDLIQSHGVNAQFAFSAHGTAGPRAMSLLGIENTDKTVIFSIIREEKSPALLAEIEKRFTTVRNSKGVAVTVPLSSVIGVSLFRFLSDDRESAVR